MVGVAIQAFNGQVLPGFSTVSKNGRTCSNIAEPTGPTEKGKLQMGLESKYQQADAAERALGANIRKAIAAFLNRHPECPRTEQAEQILFAAMDAPENDHQNPTTVASWEDVYAQVRGKLEQPAALRKQTPRRGAPAITGLTRAEVESWPARKLQAEMESSPSREQEIEAALARR
jgi:hypothetical protein